MTTETQKSVYQWQCETFGPTPNVMRTAARANEEMAELLSHLAIGDTDSVPSEIADIVIVLYGLASALSLDLMEEIDRKMAINRSRKWRITDEGHGYHL